MKRYGTIYGGWVLPQGIQLDEHSVIFGVGVGEDMSFDLLMNHHFKCKVFLIDPTQRAIQHFSEITNYFKTKVWNFSGNIQQDYRPIVENLDIDISNFVYIDKGLWNTVTKLPFFKQNVDSYVSQTLIENMYGTTFDTVETTTLPIVMKQFGIDHIDLIKLDIEGSEINVLNNMLDNRIYPTYVLVEFDLKLKNKCFDKKTETVIRRLQDNNYRIFHDSNWNITFMRC